MHAGDPSRLTYIPAYKPTLPTRRRHMEFTTLLHGKYGAVRLLIGFGITKQLRPPTKRPASQEDSPPLVMIC